MPHPDLAGEGALARHRLNVAGADEQLTIASFDVAASGDHGVAKGLAPRRRNDARFLPAGAEAYRRHLPNAEIHLLDTGHFALETHAAEIGALMRTCLQRNEI